MAITEAIRDIAQDVKGRVPWRRGREARPAAHHEQPRALEALRRETRRVVDNFLHRRDPWRAPVGWNDGVDLLGTSWPGVEVSETDDEVRIRAEVPGLEPADVEVSVSDDSVLIRGEKRAEREENGRDYWWREIAYGSFNRQVSLPAPVDADRAEARCRHGVLTLTLPKRPQSERKVRRIAVT